MITHSLSLPRNDNLPLTVTDDGAGRPLLLLHGGGGLRTVADFGARLAADFRVITPTHPGFEGSPRATSLDSPVGLAALYADLLEALDLSDVLVLGNSLGGWIAAELAVLNPARISAYLLVDAVGAEVPGHQPVDFFSLPLPAIADYSFFRPESFRIDPTVLPPAAQAAMAANRESLAIYGGTTMTDATLLGRLAGVHSPVTVAWGEADRIATPDYGRALAAAIPGARFELMLETGHLPQLETPDALAALVDRVSGETSPAPAI